MNPEGVKYGFTRTDTNGNNLNDSYDKADMNTPSILAVK